MRHRILWALSAAGLALALALPALAGDAAAERRYIDAAKADIEKANWSSAEVNIERAEQEVSTLDEATKAPLLEEIAGVKKSEEEGKAREAADRVYKQVRDSLKQASGHLENQNLDPAKYAIESARKLLAGKDAAHLDAAARTKLEGDLAAVEKAYGDLEIRLSRGQFLKRIERWLGDVEAVLKGEKQAYDNTVMDWFNYTEEALKKVPADDARTEAATERFEKGKAAFTKATATRDRDASAGKAIQYWKETLSKKGAGWETETAPPPYEVFISHSPLSLKAPLTEERYRAAREWLENTFIVKPALAEQKTKYAGMIPYAGLAFAGFAVLWLLVTLVYKDFLPASALLCAGLFAALGLAQKEGYMSEETLKKIEPAGIVVGFGATLLAFLHLFLWPYALL